MAVIAVGMRRGNLGEAKSGQAQAACINNLKDLSTAATIYQVDHDERNFPTASLRDHLLPYIKSPLVLNCPSTTHLYGTNSKLFSLDMAQLTEPERLVYLFDSTGATLGYVHGGKANVAFADGHVKSHASHEVLRMTP